MDWQPILIDAALGAIAGGIAGGVALVVRKKFANQMAYIGAFLVVFFGLMAVFRLTLVPVLQDRVAQRGSDIIAEMPLYRVMLERHPELRPQLETMVKKITDDPSTRLAAQAELTQALMPYFQTYLGQTSDDAINGFVDLYGALLHRLSTENPQVCLAMLRGEAVRMEDHIAKDQQTHFLEVVEKVVVDGAGEAGAKMDAEAFQVHLETVVGKVTSVMTIDDPEKLDPVSPKADAAMACKFTADMLTTARSDLGADGPDFLRTILTMTE